MAGELQAWDRRETESAKAYAAFLAYRAAGKDRSVAKAAEECHKGVSILNRWSQRHAWPARAAAYDIEVARLASPKALESDADALARQIEDARAIQAEARKRYESADAAKDADMSRAEAARVWAMAAKEEREARRLPAKVEASGAFVFRVVHEDEDDSDPDPPAE